MSMGQEIKIESDKRTQVEAETLKAGFLDQGFINTMRFSELNGLEEYDNSFLWILWHSYIEWGLQQITQYNSWIIRELEMMSSGVKEISDNSVVQKQGTVYLDYIQAMLDDVKVKQKIPYDQRTRIYRYFQDLAKFLSYIGNTKRLGIALDAQKVLWLLRTYLADYNENLTDAIVLYDGHYAILNGRMARGKGHMKDLLKVTSERKEREREVQMGGKHWWNRNREEEEN